MVDYRTYRLSGREKGILLAVMIALFAAGGYIFYGTVLVAVLVLPALRPVGIKVGQLLAADRQKKLRLRFRDFLYCLSASFASGRHMQEAMRESRAELCSMYSEEDMFVRELDYMLKRIKINGETDVEVLADLADRSGLEDMHDFVRIYQACRETGGNMVAAMNKTARIIGEKITIEQEIRTIIQQKKAEGMIITLMPILVILFLKGISPEYLDIMYTTWAGRVMMTVAIAGIIGAYLWIERITDIDV